MKPSWNDAGLAKAKVPREKSCPSATPPTKQTTWAAVGLKLGIHDDRLVTKQTPGEKPS